jgi:hypothetical protein
MTKFGKNYTWWYSNIAVISVFNLLKIGIIIL